MNDQMKQRAEEFVREHKNSFCHHDPGDFSDCLTALLHQVWEEGYNKGREHTTNVQAGIEEIRKVAWEEGARTAGLQLDGLYLKKGIAKGKIWIGTEGGEGGDFDVVELSAHIRRFYDENF